MIAVSLAALAIIGVQVGFNWWLARRSFRAIEEIPGLKAQAFKLQTAVVKLQNAVGFRDGTISTLRGELNGQIAARNQAEEAARHAIDELAKSGNAPAIVSALNDRLQALSRLSDVSTGSAGAAGEARDSETEVHGSVPKGDRADDTSPG